MRLYRFYEYQFVRVKDNAFEDSTDNDEILSRGKIGRLWKDEDGNWVITAWDIEWCVVIRPSDTHLIEPAIAPREFIEAMKEGWLDLGRLSDPIEIEPGLEPYADELRAWRKDQIARIESERVNELARKASELGCSVELLQMLQGFQAELRKLRNEMKTHIEGEPF